MLHFVKRTRAVKAALAAVPVKYALPIVWTLHTVPEYTGVFVQFANNPQPNDKWHLLNRPKVNR